MNLKNNFEYILTDRLGILDVFPMGESSFSINYSREDNESNLDYKKELSGKMTFVGEPFNRLINLENSIYRCEEQKIEIVKDCNGIKKSVFIGRISLNEAEFNLDKCLIVLKFMKDNKDQCFKDGKSEKINVMELISNRYVVKSTSFTGVLDVKNCSSTTGNASDVPFVWCGTNPPDAGNWIATHTRFEAVSSQGGQISYLTETTWSRELITIDCTETPEPDWILIEDNCLTTSKKTFAKKVDLINCKEQGSYILDAYDNAFYDYVCDVVGYDPQNSMIDNGLKLKDFLEVLLNSVCPNLVLKSEFFQINPDSMSSINYVTNILSNVNEIFVFQKSDVKRPNDSNNAWKLEVDFAKVLEILNKLFNVNWRIIGNVFRLEHISYFGKQTGLNINSEELKKYFVGKRVYSYQSEKIPKKENFFFKEQGSETWGVEVVYSECVSTYAKNEVKVVVEDVLTDILFAFNNSSANSKSVTDEGFVLISTRQVGTDYLINSESTINGRRLNNVFSFPILFRNFHHYNRPVKFGNVDGITTEFVSTKPNKKGEKFAIPFSVCGNEFNPDNIILTSLGNGIVDSASLRLKDCFLELNLLYESNLNLNSTLKMIFSGGGVFETLQNEKIEMITSSQNTNGRTPVLKIVQQPKKGSIDFMNGIITYLPNQDFVGVDSFSVILQSFSSTSNVQNFYISVI